MLLMRTKIMIRKERVESVRIWARGWWGSRRERRVGVGVDGAMEDEGERKQKGKG